MAPRPSLERLRTRPRADAWGDDELVSLAEAAALFFPFGPLTASSLRAARRRGELACVEVCGRAFTTPRAIRDMRTPSLASDPSQGDAVPVGRRDENAGAALAELRRRLAT
jgi:hypothetical protein